MGMLQWVLSLRWVSGAGYILEIIRTRVAVSNGIQIPAADQNISKDCVSKVSSIFIYISSLSVLM